MTKMVQTRPAAFDAIASQYDDLFTNSLIGRAQRGAVWDVACRHLRPGSSVLELNCGTGEDALFLAKCGMKVLATDISDSMIDVARSRVAQVPAARALEFVTLAIEDLGTLSPAKTFDGAFSNFSGLNCVADLQQAATDLARVLPSGSRAVLCFSNKYCLWEVVWYLLHAQPRKAFRRWTSRAIAARIGNSEVLVRYPAIRQIVAAFRPHFRFVGFCGVGIAVPPSYLEPWMRRLPGTLSLFRRVDRLVKRWPLFRGLGDHAVLVMERTTP